MRAEWLLYGMRSLIRRRRRLYPTLLSISIGMMLVVIVSTVGEIGSGLVEEEIQSLGVGSVTITANKTVADVPLTEEKLNTLREQSAVGVSVAHCDGLYTDRTQGNRGAVRGLGNRQRQHPDCGAGPAAWAPAGAGRSE